MKSLAEHLGSVRDVRAPQDAEPTPEVPWHSIREFCQGILRSPEYKMSLQIRIVTGELPPQIEALLYHYAEGKPVDRVEVRDVTTDLEELTAAQLEARALHLADMARRMRQVEDGDDGERAPGAVH